MRRRDKKFIADFWIIRAALSLSYKEYISTEQLGLEFSLKIFIYWNDYLKQAHKNYVCS